MIAAIINKTSNTAAIDTWTVLENATIAGTIAMAPRPEYTVAIGLSKWLMRLTDRLSDLGRLPPIPLPVDLPKTSCQTFYSSLLL